MAESAADPNYERAWNIAQDRIAKLEAELSREIGRRRRAHLEELEAQSNAAAQRVTDEMVKAATKSLYGDFMVADHDAVRRALEAALAQSDAEPSERIAELEATIRTLRSSLVAALKNSAQSDAEPNYNAAWDAMLHGTAQSDAEPGLIAAAKWHEEQAEKYSQSAYTNDKMRGMMHMEDARKLRDLAERNEK